MNYSHVNCNHLPSHFVCIMSISQVHLAAILESTVVLVRWCLASVNVVENSKGRNSVQKLLISVLNILHTPEYHMTAVLVDQESSGIWYITACQQQKGLGRQILLGVRWKR